MVLAVSRAMRALQLRAFRAAALIALAVLIGVGAPAYAAPTDPGTRFDLMVADAKATMLVDPAKTIVKAKAAEVAAQDMKGRQRTLGIATAQWLEGEAYLRLNDATHAKSLIEGALAAVSKGGPPTARPGWDSWRRSGACSGRCCGGRSG